MQEGHQCPPRTSHPPSRSHRLDITPGGGARTGRLREHRRLRERSDRRGAARRHGHHHQCRAQDRRHCDHQRVGQLRERAAAARHLRGEGGTRRLQDRGRAGDYRGRGRADTGHVHAGDRRRVRRSDGHRRLAAAESRPRRRLDEVRQQAAHRSPGARSQLHQVHPADARYAAAGVAACGQRKPPGLDPDDGQRPALQRHGVSARRHREPRSDSRHHRHQPDARVDRRDENHVAELRCRVRPGHGRRRLGADQVRDQQPARQRVRVLPDRQVPGAQPVHAVPGRSAHRTIRPGDRAEPVRRLDRRADQAKPVVLLRRLSGNAQHPGGLEAVDRADRGGAQRQPERVRREHLRSGDGPAVPRQRHSVGAAVAAGAGAAGPDSAAERGRAGQRDAGQFRRERLGVLHGELVQRARWMGGCPTASTRSPATASAISCATGRPRSATAAGRSW